MAKLTLTDISNISGNPTTAAANINSNSALIEAAIENTLSRDGTAPNSMSTLLDMDSHQILNLPIATTATEPVTKAQLDAYASGSLTAVDDASVNILRSNTGAVTTTLHTYMENRAVNVKTDFGALGDSTRTGGGTDDTAAIQAAVDAVVAAGGGKIFVPRGIYRITSEIDLAAGYGAPAIIFEGEGYGPWNQDTPGATDEHTTMFVCDSTTENGFGVHSVSQTVIKNISILDLNIGTRTAGAAINLKREASGAFSAVGAITGVNLKGIGIKGFYDGVKGERLQTSTLEMLFIEDCVNDGIHLSSVAAGSGTSVLLSNIFVKECGRDNFSLNGYSYIAFNNCASDLPTRHGYYVDGSVRDVTAVSFTACGFEDSSSATTGTDDTSSAAAFMTDSGASFTVNEHVGKVIHNTTDGSSGVITANAATTVTATLENGTNNNWDSGDAYSIGGSAFYFGSAIFGVTMTACFGSGATGDIIYTRANGLTILGGKASSGGGYGLNMAAGAAVTTVGFDYAGNTIGKVGGVTTKVVQINPDLSNQILLGHEQATGANNADIVANNTGGFRYLKADGTTSANYGRIGSSANGLTDMVPVTSGVFTRQWAGTNRVQEEEINGGWVLRILGEVSSTPSSPAANQARLYLEDNGAGKTRLMVIFGTGAAQQIAIEP